MLTCEQPEAHDKMACNIRIGAAAVSTTALITSYVHRFYPKSLPANASLATDSTDFFPRDWQSANSEFQFQSRKNKSVPQWRLESVLWLHNILNHLPLHQTCH